MLRTLLISNVALIDRLELELGPGLNVLTGETGAGKSILLDAFSLVLGERADTGLIRAGEASARVEALFEVGENAAVRRYLDEVGIPRDDELVIAREVCREARSRAYVNGSLTSLRVLRGLGDLLVDLHGQHDHQRLLRPAGHLALVDDLGSKAHQRRVARVRGAARERAALRAALLEQEEGARRRTIEREHLDFQIGELEEAGLEPGEDDALGEELKLLAGAENLTEGLGAVLACLDGSDDEAGAVAALERGRELLHRIAGRTGTGAVEELAARLGEQAALAADLRDDIERVLGRVGIDPERQAQVEARLQVIHRLSRKYGAHVGEMLETLAELRVRRARLDEGEASLEEQAARLAEVEAELVTELPRLGRERARLAKRLAGQVQEHLRDLAMPHATVRIELLREEDPDGLEVLGARHRLRSDGLEQARIVVGTNAGEPPGPLTEIASGGELSRVMLGIKAALAKLDLVPIMVFDEIDAGVGGETGVRMAEKLQRVSRQCQALCVTHLAQIAAVADRHLRVEKGLVDGRTRVAVEAVAGKRREQELARMLGDGGSASGRRHARHLLALPGGAEKKPRRRAVG